MLAFEECVSPCRDHETKTSSLPHVSNIICSPYETFPLDHGLTRKISWYAAGFRASNLIAAMTRSNYPNVTLSRNMSSFEKSVLYHFLSLHVLTKPRCLKKPQRRPVEHRPQWQSRKKATQTSRHQLSIRLTISSVSVHFNSTAL